jgi:regulator of sigma E protease
MLEWLRNAATFVVAIGVLVSFHEFGHFWMARRFGVRVLRFSVGFGKPLWLKRARDGVEYAVGAIPLGGYVKLLDEREGPVPQALLAQTFNRQKLGVRLAVYAAGPLFNFLLAVLLYWGMYLVGVPGLKPLLAQPRAGTPAAAAGLHAGDQVTALNGAPVPTWGELRTGLVEAALAHRPVRLSVLARDGALRQVELDTRAARMDPQYLFDDLGLTPYQPPLPPVVGEVFPGSPAAQAGLRSGDRVLSCNGRPVASFQDLQREVAAHPGEVLTLEVQRQGRTLRVSAIPSRVQVDGKTIGRLGAASARVADAQALWQDLYTDVRLPPGAALVEALQQTGQVSRLTLQMLYRMVLGDVSVKNVSGPLEIAQVTGVAASAGLEEFLWTLALISVSLGVFNLLPVPVLDGGQILYGLVEAVKGSPLSERAQILGQQIGLTLLALMMGLAFYNDIARLMG